MDNAPSPPRSPIYGLDSVGNCIQLPRWPRPNPAPEWTFDPSEGSIPTPIATHLSPIPTYSWEADDSMSTVVPETPTVDIPPWTESQPPMYLETPDLEGMPSMVGGSTVVPGTPDPMLESELIVPDTPDPMLESELIVPDTPGYESPDSNLVPEAPRVKRRRRPVEEEEWFKEILLILLPGMKDLI